MFRLLKKTLQVGKITQDVSPAKVPQIEGFGGAPEIDPDKCTRCAQCVAACPTSALTVCDDKSKDQRTFSLYYGDCVFCGLCEPACPYDAVSFRGKYQLAARKKEELLIDYSAKLSACAHDRHYSPQSSLPEKTRSEMKPGYAEGNFSDRLTFEEAGSKLKTKINKMFGRSLHIRQVDAGSSNACELEISGLGNSYYDVERLGVHFVASPRHADLLLVTGPVTRQMELALAKTYEATPFPKLVVACGTSAIDGGIYRGSYAVTGGVDRVIPVDVYIPGSPPRPEAILYGIFLVLDKI